MLNRRHKAVLFVTLVATGSSLLAGASLAEGLGVFILGATFAWVLGSTPVSRLFSSARKVPGKTWPLLKFLVVMALGGCLFVAVAVASNLNSFLTTSSAAIVGMLAAPAARNISKKPWLNWFFLLAGIGSFIGTASLVISELTDASLIAYQDAGRLAELAVYALIALLVGMYWLVKGWRLALDGINVDASGLTDTQQDANRKSTVLLYCFLSIGVVLLVSVVGSLAFYAFSDSTYAFESRVTDSQSNVLSPVFGLMLLASWPYACWSGILSRRPNNNLRTVRIHKLVTATIGGLFATVMCLAITFGIQNGSDRQTVAQINGAAKGFQVTAAKIGAIKNRDFQTTEDYIKSYEEIEPLLVEFEAKLRVLSDSISAMAQRDKTRGPLNIQRLYRKHTDWLTWDENTFALLWQDSEVTRQQIQVVKQMAQLPPGSQVEYWKEHFQPLQQDETLLREKLNSAQASAPK